MRVIGTIVEEESGKPLEGLLVRAYDRDWAIDDELGDTRTGPDGSFEIGYTEAQFRDLEETLPDVYLRVYAADGTTLLYSSAEAVRWNAEVVERFEIRIPRDKLAG